jgi:hypothetical protein
LSTKSIEVAVALAGLIVASFLMGCTVEEDMTNMGAPNEDETPEEGEIAQEPATNLVVTDFSLEKRANMVTATFGLSSEGQLERSVGMGLLVTKGSEESWVAGWSLDADALNGLNQGLAVFGNRSFELPDWGAGEYRVRLQVDSLDEIEEDREDDNCMEANLTVQDPGEPGEPGGPGLQAPEGLRKVSTYPCRIEWTDASDNEEGFNVYIGGSCACCEETTAWTKVATVCRNATGYEWSKSCCRVAECSCVMVRAFNGEVESPNSNIVMLAPVC